MKKFYKIILIAICLCFVGTGLAACTSDIEDKLVGTWESSLGNTIITFNSDGTGSYESGSGGSAVIKSYKENGTATDSDGKKYYKIVVVISNGMIEITENYAYYDNDNIFYPVDRGTINRNVAFCKV